LTALYAIIYIRGMARHAKMTKKGKKLQEIARNGVVPSSPLKPGRPSRKKDTELFNLLCRSISTGMTIREAARAIGFNDHMKAYGLVQNSANKIQYDRALAEGADCIVRSVDGLISACKADIAAGDPKIASARASILREEIHHAHWLAAAKSASYSSSHGVSGASGAGPASVRVAIIIGGVEQQSPVVQTEVKTIQ